MGTPMDVSCTTPSATNEILSSQDVELEVKKFLAGVVRHSYISPELTQTSLFLLKNVSATRNAVLEYFSTVFLVSVGKHIRLIESHQNAPILEESAIAEIFSVISDFINENPQAWAPTISSWALNLLGKISTDNAKRGRLRSTTGIYDYLQQWMSCRATRTLIQIICHCFQSLMNADTESCVKNLLNTSLVHGPHFDWVVTHVGSCFPNTVVTRVLSCGLKDFCAMGYEHEVNNPKLNSVIGILGHLAANHSHDIRSALLDLFKWSLNEDVNDDRETRSQKFATVPFLINLAMLSSTLLKVITNDFLQILTPRITPQLALFANEWCRYFNNQPETIIETTAHLALKCEQGAFQIINILLDASSSTSNVGYHSVNAAQTVNSVCRQILELILGDINRIIRTWDDAQRQANIALLNSIKSDLGTLTSLLVNPNPLRVQTAVRLLSLVGIDNPNTLVAPATFMLRNAQSDFHLAAFVRFLADSAILFVGKSSEPENAFSNHDLFAQVMEHSLKDIQFGTANEEQARQIFQNLALILRWEKSGKVSCLDSKFASRAVRSNFQQISALLLKTHDLELANAITTVFDNLDLGNNVGRYWSSQSVDLILKMTRAMVRYFFICMAVEDTIKKQKRVKIARRFLKDLTFYSPCARNFALRELLEQSIFGESAKFFGAKTKMTQQDENKLLLHQNHKQGTSVMLAQKHSSVFHTGVIGFGPRKLPPENTIEKEVVTLNRILLMDVIKSCCSSCHGHEEYPVNADALTMVSLLLVELISPDVMYNGLPWPDEEFAKVTTERDLQIRRMFKDVPHLWSLLELTAWYRPALAYCSVLLRGIAAIVMANWDTNDGVNLANVMALGQLLPSPLASIRDMLPVLEPHQITTIMKECIWAYMHENVPSPALFTRTEGACIAWRDTDTSMPNVRFTETLRLLLLANVSKLGSFYFMLFYNIDK